MAQAPRTSATDVYGLAATLYTLLTAQIPVASILRDRQPMPVPRDLQPQISPTTNQAIMRGMAIEPKFRPTTIAEWLVLLPDTLPHAANPGSFGTSLPAMQQNFPGFQANSPVQSPSTAATVAVGTPAPIAQAPTQTPAGRI